LGGYILKQPTDVVNPAERIAGGANVWTLCGDAWIQVAVKLFSSFGRKNLDRFDRSLAVVDEFDLRSRHDVSPKTWLKIDPRIITYRPDRGNPERKKPGYSGIPPVSGLHQGTIGP